MHLFLGNTTRSEWAVEIAALFCFVRCKVAAAATFYRSLFFREWEALKIDGSRLTDVGQIYHF